MPTSCPPRISAASRRCGPRLTSPPRETGRSTSTAWPSSDGGSGEGPAGTAPLAASLARSADGQVRAQGLDPGAASGQVDQLAVGPEPDHRPGPGGAEPELLPGDPQVPRRGNHPVELDRPAVLRGADRSGNALGCSGWRRGSLGVLQGAREPQVDQAALRGGHRGEPVSRGLRIQRLVRPLGALGIPPRLRRSRRGSPRPNFPRASALAS